MTASLDAVLKGRDTMKNDTKKQPHIAHGLAVETDTLIEQGVFTIGDYYTVETVNPIYHGKLLAITPSFYILEEACWIGDCGNRTAYETGTPPAEANYMGKSPLLIERSACVLGPKRSAHQKCLK